MAPKQLGLSGVPQPEARKIIEVIEDACLERKKECGKRSKIAQRIHDMGDGIQKLLIERDLDSYTYEDADGVLRTVYRESGLKERKAKKEEAAGEGKKRKKASAEA
jgi:hypothetical protein